MGLDMYLKANKYISGYDHSGTREVLQSVIKAAGINPAILTVDAPSISINATVMYWRKANAIHGWFVDNCQDGEDNCQESDVSRDSLEELQKLCEEAVTKKDSGDLTPTEGFFFGSTEVDEYYWEELQRTAEGLKRLLADESLKDCDFSYRASW